METFLLSHSQTTSSFYKLCLYKCASKYTVNSLCHFLNDVINSSQKAGPDVKLSLVMVNPSSIGGVMFSK